MKKQQKPFIIKNIGQVIDLDPKVFEDAYFKTHRSLSEVSGMKKLLELEYVRAEYMKNDIIKRIKEGEITKKESENSLFGLYAVLQRIEDKAVILQKHIEEIRAEKKQAKRKIFPFR